MRVAVVDCGTNAIRLLVADAGERPGRLVEVDRRLELVRLGQGVDATGEFHPQALARTFAAAERLGGVIRHLGVDRVRFVATSAARDVSNRDVFFAGIHERLGVTPEVISGADEARWSFVGALTGVSVRTDPVLVIDIGGGSTELVLGHADGTITRAVSVDVGSVRLRERIMTSDPPTAREVLEAVTVVNDALDGSGIDFASVRTFVAVAGTVTTLAAAHQELPAYDRAAVHGSRMHRDELAALTHRLLTSPIELVRLIASMHPQRAEVICAGALIAQCVAERVGTEEMTVCETDILDGVALELLAEPAAAGT